MSVSVFVLPRQSWPSGRSIFSLDCKGKRLFFRRLLGDSGRDELDFDFTAEGAGGAIQGGKRDRSIFGIEQPMNRGSRGAHLRGHGAFVHAILLHQVVELECHGTLERGSLYFFMHPLFLEKAFEASATMFVSIPGCF